MNKNLNDSVNDPKEAKVRRRIEEKPLDYDIDSAPPGDKIPSRRLFLKLVLGSAAASYIAPKAAIANAAKGISPIPVSLPFHFNFENLDLKGEYGTIEGDVNAQYTCQVTGMLDIDGEGNVTINGFSAQGVYTSGDDLGPLSVIQRHGEVGTGIYEGTNLNASIPIYYSDNTVENYSTVLNIYGLLSTAEWQLNGEAEIACNDTDWEFHVVFGVKW